MKRGPKTEGFLYSFSTTLNPKDNGGEAITLGVDVYKDSQNVFLETQCYGTHSSRINLAGVSLNDLEKAIHQIKDDLALTHMVEEAARQAHEKHQ